jgi:hypothetical protein
MSIKAYDVYGSRSLLDMGSFAGLIEKLKEYYKNQLTAYLHAELKILDDVSYLNPINEMIVQSCKLRAVSPFRDGIDPVIGMSVWVLHKEVIFKVWNDSCPNIKVSLTDCKEIMDIWDLEEFSYWNNTDKPDDVEDWMWERRESRIREIDEMDSPTFRINITDSDTVRNILKEVRSWEKEKIDKWCEDNKSLIESMKNRYGDRVVNPK